MKYLYISILFAFALVSCEDKLEVDAPDFDVLLDGGATYKVGDTVRFIFNGNADNITFYSGLPGAAYEFRERTELEGGKPQFEVETQYGGGGTQPESFRVLVSSELEAMDSASVVSTNWIDITDKVALATNATRIASGPVDLSAYTEAGKPLFLAFKFLSVTDADRAAGAPIINVMTAGTVLDDGSMLPVATNATAEYSIFNFQGDTEWFFRANQGEKQDETHYLVLGGGQDAPVNEDWLISKPLFFTQVPPDTGFPIQNVGTNRLEEYTFIYNAPGTYKVTFIASNYTVDEFKEVKKEFEIRITE